jgi:hydrogenase nickel incorporation protein HypA/HybF
MHELSIAQSVIDTVLQEMQLRGIPQVSKIVLRIGVWSGVMAEAVQFSFERLRLDTVLQSTALEIEEPGLQLKCRSCGKITEVRTATLECPACHSDQIEVLGGDELEIAFVVPGE